MWRRSAVALCVALALTACRHELAAAPPPVAYTPLASFPPLGDARPVEKGVVVHEVSFGHGNIWIYLPTKLPKTPIPAVFIAPAGVPPFVGNGFGPSLDTERHPEHLPYVHAGFAVVAYDVDGELPEHHDVTYAEVQSAAAAFMAADAGMSNARHAIDYVLKMVPAIDPKRLYSAGHSSAGRLSLLLAATDPRIAACLAYAPVTDPEHRATVLAPEVAHYLETALPGFREFLHHSSPLARAAALHCPVFVFHSEGDHRIPIADTATFVATLQKTNPHVTFVRTKHGDHYDSMIEEGVPAGIRWLRAGAGTLSPH